VVISDKHKCIFVACQKTGSTSIRTTLANVEGITTAPMHRGCVKSREIVGPDKWDSYYTFAFVRNPWDRQLSIFFHYKKQDAIRYRNTKDNSFRKWTETNLGMNSHPCYRFIYDEDGNQLTKFIGRYENLVGDFNKVCSKVGFGILELSHKLNQVEKNKIHYRQYYRKKNGQFDFDLIDLVRKKWAKDIEYFGYKF
jgi:hypothetical protein